jgi:Sulfotransferase domain
VIRHLSAGMRRVLGLHRQGRRLPVLPDDTLLASYPSSGDLWFRFLVANLVHPDRTVDFRNLNRLIIDPNFTVKRDVDRAPRPRIVHTHRSFDPRYRRIIYLVRDPRDVALAQYRQLRKTGNEFALANFIDSFLAGDLNRNLGSWGENVSSWIAGRFNCSGFALLRFEDLVSDTGRELTRVANFAGWPAGQSIISHAIERSSPEEMRKMQKQQVRNPATIASADTLSEWKSELPKSQVMRIENAWGEIMSCLGYECLTLDPRVTVKPSLIGMLTAAGIGGKPASVA